jgi:hypothetical protein
MGFGMSRERYLPPPESQILFPFCFVEDALEIRGRWQSSKAQEPSSKEISMAQIPKSKNARTFVSILKLGASLEFGAFSALSCWNILSQWKVCP